MSGRTIRTAGWAIGATLAVGAYLYDKPAGDPALPDGHSRITQPLQSYDALHNQPPIQPISMGGYEERHTAHASDSLQISEQIQFLKDKADFIVAMQACMGNTGVCDPKIGKWAERIVDLRHISDKAKRLKELNFMVNANLHYARDLADGEVPMASLTSTATTERGRCGEIALFKLAIAELTGFSAQDVRYVWVGYFENNQLTYSTKTHSPITHAVLEVRVDGKNWVLDDNLSSPASGEIDIRQADDLAIFASRMETDTVKLNVSGASVMWGKKIRMQPIAEFNSSEIADYAVPTRSWKDLDPNPPLAAVYARAETTDLSAELSQGGAENIFIQGTVTATLSDHYTIKNPASVADTGDGDRAVCDDCDETPKPHRTANDNQPKTQKPSANGGDDYLARYEQSLEKIAAANNKTYSQYYGHPRP